MNRRIKFLQSVAGLAYAFDAWHPDRPVTYEMESMQAESWVRQGLAEYVIEAAAVEPRTEKATRKRKPRRRSANTTNNQ